MLNQSLLKCESMTVCGNDLDLTNVLIVNAVFLHRTKTLGTSHSLILLHYRNTLTFIVTFFLYKWPSASVPDLQFAVTGSNPARGCCVYQCQLSVPSLRGRLMSTSES